ncbi:MAG: hypothetical protein ACYTHJ_11415 [Planctomycetota bacterium]|jgi:hypothetical protein
MKAYKTCWLSIVVAMIAAMTLSGNTAQADHIPGHNDDDPIFPAPIPGKGDFNGGGVILFVTLIGPDGGTTIYNTSLDITYVSDGVTPASDLVLEISTFVDGQLREWDVSGADLGFGSGPGTFKGKLDTDIFNGIIDGGIPGPFSTISLDIGSTSGPVNGTAFFVDSFINFLVEEPAVAIPAVSQWGLAATMFLLLGVGTVLFRRGMSPATAIKTNNK